MRYRLTAVVKGNLYLEQPTKITSGETLFEFLPDASGKLVSVSVSKEIPEDKRENFRQHITIGHGAAIPKIVIGGDKELHYELIKELQVLESTLSFASWGICKQIDWHTPEQEYISETPDDEELIGITKFAVGKKASDPPVRITQECLRGLIEKAPNYSLLYVPKAFWRAGMVYFDDNQYIQAFYQFYFVIEGFYLQGKSSKKQVMAQYQKINDLQEIIRRTFEQVSADLSLQPFYREYKCEVSPSGLFELFFEIRNNLHHYYGSSTRKQGTPLNQDDFKAVALAIMCLAVHAISTHEVRITKSLSNTLS